MALTLSKKRIFSIFIFVSAVFIALGGVFYYIWHMPDSPLYRWWVEEMEMGGGPKDFSIEKSDTGTIVINKREKFQAIVPDEWSAVKAEPTSYDCWGVNLFSPDTKVKRYSVPYDFVLDDGCAISVFIEKGSLKYRIATDQISEGLLMEKEELPSMEDDGIEMIKLGNHWAIERISTYFQEHGRRIRVIAPLDDERYVYIILSTSLNNIEECSGVFEGFLENISENN